jgi:hypothetical protein
VPPCSTTLCYTTLYYKCHPVQNEVLYHWVCLALQKALS